MTFPKAPKGLRLTQTKEPALSRPVKTLTAPKMLYLPAREDDKLYVQPKKAVLAGMPIYPTDSHFGVSFPVYRDSVLTGFRTFPDTYHDVSFASLACTEGGSFTSIPECEMPPAPEDILGLSRACAIWDNCDHTPLHKKLARHMEETVQTLIVYGIDDQPYISVNSSPVFAEPELLLKGIELANQLIGATNIRILLPKDLGEDAPKSPKKLGGDIPVSTLRVRYPHRATALANETTVVISAEALVRLALAFSWDAGGMMTTVSVMGDCVSEPCNVRVPVGTPVEEVLEFAGLSEEPRAVILGGSLTGSVITDLATPILPGMRGVLAFRKAKSPRQYDCIGCGKCIQVCPQKLMPVYIYKAYQGNNKDEMKRLKVLACTDCGCCSYICPSNLELTNTLKQTKRLIKEDVFDEAD
ncbi:MAG: 4Fe-4S dicluster domain-containing protein [Ruminococcaceae bacterium]|nr:4Fe-4S dicluster domain-containing protein [Oscillospiraceae bacterium]